MPGESIQHLGGGTADRTAFELGVVLDAHARQSGDLTAPQARDASVGPGGKSDLVGCDPSAA